MIAPAMSISVLARDRRPRRAALAAMTAVAIAAGARPHATRAAPVAVQLLAVNDVQGNLDPPEGSNGRIDGVIAGGVEYLATHLAQLRQSNPNTIVVSAGDNISASPLISGLFHDEPAIEALNAAGLGHPSAAASSSRPRMTATSPATGGRGADARARRIARIPTVRAPAMSCARLSPTMTASAARTCNWSSAASKIFGCGFM
jgi:hypothetical protein